MAPGGCVGENIDLNVNVLAYTCVRHTCTNLIVLGANSVACCELLMATNISVYAIVTTRNSAGVTSIRFTFAPHTCCARRLINAAPEKVAAHILIFSLDC